MNKPSHVIEIFLQPGNFYFGDRDTRIRTILGSCVAITMWHPGLLIGGMCHFMLPARATAKMDTLDGRYADEAMAMFMREIRAAGTHPSEYQVKLFGGGNMFPNSRPLRDEARCKSCNPLNCKCRRVSCRNESTARMLVEKDGFSIHASSLGGAGHRQIFFDIWTGHVWSRYRPVVPSPDIGEAA